MKNIVFVVLLLLFGSVTHAQNNFKRNIEMLSSSNLTIIGDSNIAKFQCDFNTSYLEKTQVIKYAESGSQIKFSQAILILSNKGFDCGSRGINRDFHDLLKSEEYPKILLELSKIDLSESSKGIASVIITIAGKKNTYKVPVTINNDGIIAEFEGTLKLDIKDYGLEPPKKLFGMIVVKDDIEIHFDLFIKK